MVEITGWSTILVTIPLTILIKWKFVTRLGVPMGLQLASKTRNLAGTVLPCLKMLEPSGSIGGRIVRPGWPLNKQLVDGSFTKQTQLWVTELPLQSVAQNVIVFAPDELVSTVSTK